MPLNAIIHIATALQNGRTVLKNSHCTQPFKVANITEDRAQKELRLMLMSSSPGILDGDDCQMKIAVGEGCHLSLETQSFQRVFQMKNGASQETEIRLASGSSFSFLPHPVVPHRDAIFRAKNKIWLEEECSLVWGEVISCGRKLNGEIFQFSLYHGITEVFLKNKLVVKENLLLKPKVMNLQAIGQMEGFTHQATLLFIDESISVQEKIDNVRSVLEDQENIMFGVSALPVNGLIIRLLGQKAEHLFALLKELSLLLRRHSVNTTSPAVHVA